MRQVGTLYLSSGSVSLEPNALDEIRALAQHPWEQNVLKILESWWGPKDFMEIHTSGSTGITRWIRHDKTAMVASANRTLRHFELEPGAHAALAMPVEFVGGMMMLIRAVEGAMDLTVLEPIMAPDFPKTPFDFVALTPAQSHALSADKEQLHRMKGWKTLLLGGAPVRSEWLRGLPSSMRVFESFGMTETISHFAVRQWLPVKEEVFRCLEGMTVSCSSQGALQVHRVGFPVLQSNDAAEVMDSHTFRWLGRLDDVINSGGVKVHPQAVSTVLSAMIPLPFIVYGRPHDDLGEEVVLRIHANEEPENADEFRASIQHLVLESLPRYHAPRSIEWKPLEKTQSGKWKSPR